MYSQESSLPMDLAYEFIYFKFLIRRLYVTCMLKQIDSCKIKQHSF